MFYVIRTWSFYVAHKCTLPHISSFVSWSADLLLSQHGCYSRTVVLRLLERKYKSLVSHNIDHQLIRNCYFIQLIKCLQQPNHNIHVNPFILSRLLRLFSSVSVTVNAVNASQTRQLIPRQQSSSGTPVSKKQPRRLSRFISSLSYQA